MTILNALKKHRITILLLVLIFVVLQLLANHFRGIAKDIAEKSFLPYKSNEDRYKEIVTSDDIGKVQTTKTLEILSLADGHKLHHQEIALNTFRFRYTTVTMLMICSILVASILLYITPKGWNNINDNLKAIFLFLVAHSAFYGGSSVVYEQENTLKDNVDQYIKIDNIQKELISEVMTFQLADSTAQDTLIHQLNKSITQANNKIIEANEIKFNLKEYKVTLDSLKQDLPE